MNRRTLACARNLLSALLFVAPAAGQDGGLSTWLGELKGKADDADVALIEKVAATGSRSAAEGLVEAYDGMRSIYMRLQILRALPAFEGDGEEAAMKKLAEVAGSTEVPELQAAAIQGLGKSKRFGKSFLGQIVDSTEVPDDVREQALAAHVELATPEDAPWYRYIWNLERERRKADDGFVLGPEPQAIRLMAFEALADRLDADELIETMRTEVDPKIRRAALRVMHERDLPPAEEMAKWMLESVFLPGDDRIAAARILVERIGAAAGPTFVELAKKRDVTPENLRYEMARLIVEIDNEELNKLVARQVGRGRPHQKVFALHASRHLSDPKVLKAVRKQLHDRSPEVRQAAAEVVGARGDEASLPLLRKLLEKPPTPDDRRIAIEAISAIVGDSPEWLVELRALSKGGERDARNAALEELAATGDDRFLPDLFAALEHEDWTTRLLAIRVLTDRRQEEAVPRLIDRLEQEQGRLQDAVAEALWQLTGQPFEKRVDAWRAWWAEEGESFRALTPSELAEAEKERELRRLKERTRSGARFFGIRVESHRVIFIVDSSGSMIESVYGRRIGKRGAARIDVAKEELARCIENLEPNSLFNVYAFSNGVERWLEGEIADNTEASRKAALTWVERLGARGGTNIYDSLRMAFEDPEVDTICLLSDGDPTVGDEIDPHRIRERVAFWNEHRRVKIHTVAIGNEIKVDLLEWLAEDSGGDHVHIR